MNSTGVTQKLSYLYNVPFETQTCCQKTNLIYDKKMKTTKQKKKSYKKLLVVV